MIASASYGAYSKHKFNPTAYGLTPYAGSDEERSYCDEHAGFKPGDHARVPLLLKRGILAGLWGENASETPPRILWTIDDNGWIYELRRTNIESAQYHGYPLLPSDAFAKQIIDTFSQWALTVSDVQLKQDPKVRDALAAAQVMYR